MAILHVRDVSDDTMATLKRRAARAGQSVQAYVRQLLDADATTLTNAEAAARAREIAAGSSVDADDVVAAVAAARERG